MLFNSESGHLKTLQIINELARINLFRSTSKVQRTQNELNNIIQILLEVLHIVKDSKIL
jgi:hypothetical protein